MEINNPEKLLEKIHSSLERIALALEKQAKVFEEQNYYEDENASTTPASDTNDVFDKKKKEAPLIDEMSVECANWAKNNHLKNVTKQDVELFLHEHETELSPQGHRLLWTKSKFRLRGD